ncbi:MAG: restriction endonuclease subunit S [Thermoanaerobaculia bacterium]
MMKFNFYHETNFKQTEIGLLPQEWEVVKLGEVVNESKAKNKNNEKFNVYSVSNIRGFVLSNEFFEKQVYSKNLQNYKIVEENYFAYNPARVNVGSIALFSEKEKGLVSPMYIVFKIVEKEKLNHHYLFKILKSEKYINEIKRISKSRGSVRQILAFVDLCEILIPLPPLPEQQAIAEVLSIIQQAKEKTEAVIKATREIKKSMMKHLFTYGNVPLSDVDRVKLKETEIGSIPEHWQVVRLGEVSEIKSGGTPSKKEETYWVNGKIPWIRSEKCQDCFIYNTKEFITEEGLSNSSAKIFEKGTVLIAMVGATIGKTGYLMFPATTNQNVAGLKPNNTQILSSLYLFYYLQNRYNDFAKEGGYKIANLSFIKSFLIPLPPLSEQQAIADILQAIDEKIQKEEAKKKALENLFKSMLSNLMSGRIRVKIENKE